MSLPPGNKTKEESRDDTKSHNGLQLEAVQDACHCLSVAIRKQVRGSLLLHLDLQRPVNQFLTNSLSTLIYKATYFIQTFIDLHNKRKETEKNHVYKEI